MKQHVPNSVSTQCLSCCNIWVSWIDSVQDWGNKFRISNHFYRHCGQWCRQVEWTFQWCPHRLSKQVRIYNKRPSTSSRAKDQCHITNLLSCRNYSRIEIRAHQDQCFDILAEKSYRVEIGLSDWATAELWRLVSQNSFQSLSQKINFLSTDHHQIQLKVLVSQTIFGKEFSLCCLCFRTELRPSDIVLWWYGNVNMPNVLDSWNISYFISVWTTKPQQRYHNLRKKEINTKFYLHIWLLYIGKMFWYVMICYSIGTSYIVIHCLCYTGCFFHWYPPKKFKYGKPRLGESTST